MSKRKKEPPQYTAYRKSHSHCWFPHVDLNERWHLCGKIANSTHHIVGRGGEREIEANYIRGCDFPIGNCHMGIGHGLNKDVDPPSAIRLQLLAVKIIMKEATYEEAQTLMKGRSWYQPIMGDVELKDVLSSLVIGIGKSIVYDELSDSLKND